MVITCAARYANKDHTCTKSLIRTIEFCDFHLYSLAMKGQLNTFMLLNVLVISITSSNSPSHNS